MIVNCCNCKKSVYKKPYALKHSANVFCGISCHYEYKKKIGGHIVGCKNCNVVFRKIGSDFKRTNNHFCSQKCANVFNRHRPKHYIDGRKMYREIAIKEYGYKCANANCIISGIIKDIPTKMFDVDHVKGKIAGHGLENLQVLCVWCHALKTRKVDNDSIV
jgi:hypothetical protein